VEESSSSAGGNLVSTWENERTGSVEPTTDNNCENEDFEEGMNADVLEKREKEREECGENEGEDT
jgi:hypothetical protein